MFRVAHLLALASTAAGSATVQFKTYDTDACDAAAVADQLASGADDLNTADVGEGDAAGQNSAANTASNTFGIDTCYNVSGGTSIKFVRPTDIGKTNCTVNKTAFSDADCATADAGNDVDNVGNACTAFNANDGTAATDRWYKAVCSEQYEAGTAEFKAHVFTDATCDTAGTQDGRDGLFGLADADLTSDVNGFTTASYNANAFNFDQCYTNEADKSFKFSHAGCDATDGGVTLTKYDSAADCTGDAAANPATKVFNGCIADSANTTGDDDNATADDYWYRIGTVADATACPTAPGSKFAAKHFSVVVALVAGVMVQLL